MTFARRLFRTVIDAVLGVRLAAAGVRTIPASPPAPRYRILEQPARGGETMDVVLLDFGIHSK
jgi:hypothetical protein